MAVTVEVPATIFTQKATFDDGVRVELIGQVPTGKKTFYKIEEMNIKANHMNYMNTLAKVCKSSKDIEIVGELINQADYNNDISIAPLTEFAKEYGIGIEALKKLLQRTVQEGLFHKIGTGYYMLNPYIIMGKKLTSASYDIQELTQIRWRKLTGVLTDKQLDKLIKLNQWLQLDSPLRANEFNLSLAEYFYKHRTLTKLQLEKLGVKETPIGDCVS